MRDEVPNERLRSLLTSRGPDHQAHHVIQLQIQSRSYFLVFYACLLHMRRKQGLQTQPLVSQETGDVLLFNGELFDMPNQGNNNDDEDGDDALTPNCHHEQDDERDDDGSNDGSRGLLQVESDSRLLFDRLQAAAAAGKDGRASEATAEEATATFVDVMSGLKGPFSIIFYRHKEKELWIGKDCLGRRSLCFASRRDPDAAGPGFQVSSVCDPDPAPAADQTWCEVPANGFYRFRLPDFVSSYHLSPRSPADPGICLFEWDRSPTTDCVQTHDLPFPLPHMRVKAAVRSPITCSLNASAAAVSMVTPVNVMSQSQGNKSCTRHQAHQPARDHELGSGKEVEGGEEATIGELLVADQEVSVVRGLERVLDLSVKRRIRLFHGVCDSCCRSRRRPSPQTPGNEEQQQQQDHDDDDNEESIGLSDSGNNRSGACDHASIGVLFSGGIDCTVIALIADRFVPERQPIDLINVSFAPGSPDRLTSQAALAELRKLCPHRRFQLVHVDVGKEELVSCRQQVISRLIYPSASVLDDSTGSAFYFASRGIGCLVDQETGKKTSYRSPARVLLNGLGSDEQMAGYARHRRIFHTEGVDALNAEIAREVDQLHRRNLGRDDRVASHHGREVRFPFLDEDIVSFLNGLPIGHKCNLRLDRGIGEKRVLRQLAVKLGLRETATREKRAIQFGSRIAKLEDRKEKGDMICSRLIIPSP